MTNWPDLITLDSFEPATLVNKIVCFRSNEGEDNLSGNAAVKGSHDGFSETQTDSQVYFLLSNLLLLYFSFRPAENFTFFESSHEGIFIWFAYDFD